MATSSVVLRWLLYGNFIFATANKVIPKAVLHGLKREPRDFSWSDFGTNRFGFPQSAPASNFGGFGNAPASNFGGFGGNNNMFARNDLGDGRGGDGGGRGMTFPNSPFGSSSFQPSFSTPVGPAPSMFSSFPAAFNGGTTNNPFQQFPASNINNNGFPPFPNIASGFSANQQPFGSPFTQPPASAFVMSPPAQPQPFQMPVFTNSMPTQWWGTSSDTSSLQDQINNIFKQNALPQNFVQDKFNEGWAKATQQFGPAQTSKFPTTQFGSLGSQSNMFAGTQPGSLETAKNAFAVEDFSKSLSQQLKLNKTQAAASLPFVSFPPSQAPVEVPAEVPEQVPVEVPAEPRPEVDVATEPPAPPVQTPAVLDCQDIPIIPVADFLNPARQPACARNKYRTHTGECNNICFPNRGKESTVYSRMLSPDYADGIAEPRRSSRNRPLPSARVVSTTFIGKTVHLAPTWTNMFMQFGQFLDHDLTQTPRAQLSAEAPECCGTNNPHPQCLTISIPPNDAFYSKFQQNCMEFVRSLPGLRPGCRLGSREQINQLTAFIDGSQIYGIRPKDVKELRAFTGGLLKSTQPFHNNPSYTLLPGDTSSSATCVDGTSDKACFKAGDSRCNVQLGLQTMHTVWMRHHNNIANRLVALNPDWDDEKLYHEARAVVGAQLQHITYKEWLPLLLGTDAISQFGLDLLQSGRFRGYNVTTDPALLNEFAAAAFRVGHAMVPPKFNRLNGDFSLRSTENVQDTFFKSHVLYEENSVDELVRGLASQPGKVIENSIVTDLTQQLFATSRGSFGLDLTSLNIQRGRDHGIQGYMKWRQVCGLPTANNFNSLKQLGILPDDVANRLASIYETVEDIDLYPAGIAEIHQGEAFIGPTFSCIIAEQFRRLRSGDRFWYENDLPFSSKFSDKQLTQIRRSSLARILCDTVPGIQQMQPFGFLVVSSSNPRSPCDNLPAMSLKPWIGI